MLITISISSAPWSNAIFVSYTFTLVALYPKGKPMTVHIKTSVFASCSLAYLIYDGAIHTDLKSYFIASLINLSISVLVA